MANKIYVARETPTVWSDSAQTLVMTLNNLAGGAGFWVCNPKTGATRFAWVMEDKDEKEES